MEYSLEDTGHRLEDTTQEDTMYEHILSYKWDGATPGEHTIVSRATDVNGLVQPTVEELARKKTFLEDNSQMPRKVKIA
jgi:hypothetical protein